MFLDMYGLTLPVSPVPAPGICVVEAAGKVDVAGDSFFRSDHERRGAGETMGGGRADADGIADAEPTSACSLLALPAGAAG